MLVGVVGAWAYVGSGKADATDVDKLATKVEKMRDDHVNDQVANEVRIAEILTALNSLEVRLEELPDRIVNRFRAESGGD